MQPRDRADELVVTTPELVAFEYDVAGLGSRFLAQLIDLLLLALVILAVTILAAVIGAFGNSSLLTIIYFVGEFALVLLYFPFYEALTNGQTLGKRAMRLRVVGDRGEPVTVTQVAIRNLIRIVDFLPALYGIGIITLFIQGGAKRLGDFAAGTLVVRERDRVKLHELVKSAEAARSVPGAEGGERASIWAGGTGSTPSRAVAPAPAPSTASPYELAVKRLSPELLRFINAYAARRDKLTVTRREQLAAPVAGALAQLLPREVAAYGSLAVLDGLAGLLFIPRAAPPVLPPPSQLPPPSPLPPPSRVPEPSSQSPPPGPTPPPSV
jgi:uncharacterized RDD family membrane protein YckC